MGGLPYPEKLEVKLMSNLHRSALGAILRFGAGGALAVLSSAGPAPAAAAIAASTPITVGNAGMLEVPFAAANAAAVTLASAPGAWGGARTGSEPTLSDRVVDYRLQATLDPVKHTVD